MNIYIDESGSINNKAYSHSPFFIIALVHVKDKDNLKRVYKRFVSSNIPTLKKLDIEKLSSSGKVLKEGGKMFDGEKFKELKGSQFDHTMKRKFLEFFSRNPYFEVFFIKIHNDKLSDKFCSNTARCFNYILKLALHYYIDKGLLPNEECILQLDERNEKTEARFFLENYLNTELTLGSGCTGPFKVSYFDSCDNCFIQIADVFANWYYSHLFNKDYEEEYNNLKEKGIIKRVFDFPLIQTLTT